MNLQIQTCSRCLTSWGLSLESAKWASKRVQFKTPDKPDKLLSLLKSYHFSQTQISKIASQFPTLLVSEPEKTVLPKLEFFRSKGLCNPEIAKVISSCPFIFCASLEDHIIPTYDFIRGLLGSEKKTNSVIKRYKQLFTPNMEPKVIRNLSILRDNGVPEFIISDLLIKWPVALSTSSDRMKEVVKEAREMGFDPSSLVFIQAFKVLVGMRKSVWESKVGVFKQWNLSEEHVLFGFRRFPQMLLESEKKIAGVMELLVNKMGWEPSVILEYPVLLALSLERILVPRASVLQYLVSRGLMDKERICPALFLCTEDEFQLKFLKCYPEAPELLRLYFKKPALP